MQASGVSGQESAGGGGMAAFLDDSLSMHALDSPSDLPPWRSGGRNGTVAAPMRNPSLRASGRSFSAMQAMEGDEKVRLSPCICPTACPNSPAAVPLIDATV